MRSSLLQSLNILFVAILFDRILHLFPWSGVVNEESQLSDTFRVPDPKTGQMRRLISQIPANEEEMFRNMIRRLNTIVKVVFLIFRNILLNYETQINIHVRLSIETGGRRFRCAHYDRCRTNVFPAGHIAHHIGNDAKI